jgi:hypothetical protein
MRTIAAAVRLSGRLDVMLLRDCLARLVERHESLRTRIVVRDGIPMQHVDEPGRAALELISLTGVAQDCREAQARHLAEELVYEPFLVAAGPLFVARLIEVSELDHVLAIAMDHIVADIASLGIAWREIFTPYAQSARGMPVSLPEMSVQFPDYAVWEQRADSLWQERHGAYWRERLAGARRVRLFPQEALDNDAQTRRAWLPIRFGKELSAGLRELSRRERSTLVMSVLTAYVGVVCRLYEESDLVVPFTTGGRLRPELGGLIGYFGVPLFLRIGLFEEDSWLDLLKRVSGEYGAAYEHSDSCRMAAGIPGFVWNPAFNWIPGEFAAVGGDAGLAGGLGIQPYAIKITIRDGVRYGAELRVDLRDSEDGVMGTVGYRADLFSREAVERFGRNFRVFAERMVGEPRGRVAAMEYAR